MSHHVAKNSLLIGAGPMALDYFKVLNELKCPFTVLGRGEESAIRFKEKTGKDVVTGGIADFLSRNNEQFDAVIVAVGMEQLQPVTCELIKKGYKNILLEKPAGLNAGEINELAARSAKAGANVLVAYNRRFYASVQKAKEIIEKEGGVSSFNFEFTEWAHVIEPLKKAPGVKENWLLANSTHVIDLAFYLGGIPVELCCYANGELSWHDKAIFSGAGKTQSGALFSYQANWMAPGRWGVEVLTPQSRLIFRPMEDLQIQNKGSVAITKVEFDQSLDTAFKPGLYLQTKQFLEGRTENFITIEKQAEMLAIYERIAAGK